MLFLLIQRYPWEFEPLDLDPIFIYKQIRLFMYFLIYCFNYIKKWFVNVGVREGFCIVWCRVFPVFFSCSAVSFGSDWWAMQRSRRALLQRTALEKGITGRRNCFYKVSLSLVFVLWGLVFLFSLWISFGHGYRGKLFKLSLPYTLLLNLLINCCWEL